MAERLRRLLTVSLLGLVMAFGAAAALAQGETTPIPAPEITPEPLRNPALLADDALLTGEPCVAPCWRGITPGEISWNNALAILQVDPTLQDLQVQEDANSDAKSATWAQADGVNCCQIFSLDGQTVSILFLRLAPDITLGEVVEVQGEPAFAIGSPFTDDQAILNLIYPDARIVIYAFAAGTVGSVSAESEVIGVLYMSSQDLDLLLGTSSLYEWRGYGDFAAYSPDEGAAFDVTPIMTATPTG